MENAEMGHLITRIENPIEWTRSDESDSFTLGGLDTSYVKKVTGGVGVFYFFYQPSEEWASGIVMANETPVIVTSRGFQGTVFSLARTAVFPSTGIITNSMEGYLVSPTIRIELEQGGIALMLLTPRSADFDVSVEKATLSVPSADATIKVSSEGGELRCSGTISGSKLDTARLVVNRNSTMVAHKEGYDEDLCRASMLGAITAYWKPVRRNFEECLFAFYLANLDAEDFEDVTHWLGAPELEYGNTAPFVVGDGPGTEYKLRLVADHLFHKRVLDETRFLVV
jgi:hypothetical protein